jgi:hypothetical protein
MECVTFLKIYRCFQQNYPLVCFKAEKQKVQPAIKYGKIFLDFSM